MRFFTLVEFDSPDQPGSGSNMDPTFLGILDSVREEANIPFHVNSGYRSESHNLSVGGKSDSSHRRGKAADIEALSGNDKYVIVQAAIKKGIKRIGIGKSFVHLDTDSSLPFPVIWTY